MLQTAVRRVASSAVASSSSSSSASSPLRLAIIGSGPSGFYSAARVLSATKNEQSRDVQVHMYERLPVPNGLVRFGVAPDHLDVKNVEHKFAEVAQDPRFTFFGNVNVVGSSEGASTEESREMANPPRTRVASMAVSKASASSCLSGQIAERRVG